MSLQPLPSATDGGQSAASEPKLDQPNRPAAPALAELDWPLRTRRLLIRPCRVDDAEALYALRLRPEVATWAHSVPTDLDGWRRRFRDPEIYPHLLTVELDGQVIGELMVHVRDGAAQKEASELAVATEAELGWLIAPEHQGQGLATEAGRALLEISFGPLGLRRVVATTFEANHASWRVMEKIGMRLETRSRRDVLHRDQGWIDGRGYALLDVEWREHAPTLEASHRSRAAVPVGDVDEAEAQESQPDHQLRHAHTEAERSGHEAHEDEECGQADDQVQAACPVPHEVKSNPDSHQLKR